MNKKTILAIVVLVSFMLIISPVLAVSTQKSTKTPTLKPTPKPTQKIASYPVINLNFKTSTNVKVGQTIKISVTAWNQDKVSPVYWGIWVKKGGTMKPLPTITYDKSPPKGYNTGTFTWTPKTKGDWDIEFVANDDYGHSNIWLVGMHAT